MPYTVKTRYGEFVPCSDASDLRKKYRCAVELYEGGNVRSLYLQEPQTVSFPAGDFQAELMTFYEDGSIKRVFPLYGQISAYWSIEDELEEAPYYDLIFEGEKYRIRPQCIYFYPSGEIRSVTLWPGDELTVNTPSGAVRTKLGIELYESGEIRSIDPVFGTVISTPYGDIRPFVYRDHMLHAENASLVFSEDGDVIGFSSLATEVCINGEVRHRPEGYRSPLTVRINGSSLVIKGGWGEEDIIDSSSADIRFV